MIVEGCRNCNKRRCRFRQNLPKRKSKRQLERERLLSKYVQLDLFDDVFVSSDCPAS